MSDLLKELADKHALNPFWKGALLAFGRELLEKAAEIADGEYMAVVVARRLREIAKGGKA
jgi:hypothetical protein